MENKVLYFLYLSFNENGDVLAPILQSSIIFLDGSGNVLITILFTFNPKNGSCHFAVDARRTVFSYSTYAGSRATPQMR